jgi:hypothetical protein
MDAGQGVGVVDVARHLHLEDLVEAQELGLAEIVLELVLGQRCLGRVDAAERQLGLMGLERGVRDQPAAVVLVRDDAAHLLARLAARGLCSRLALLAHAPGDFPGDAAHQVVAEDALVERLLPRLHVLHRAATDRQQADAALRVVGQEDAAAALEPQVLIVPRGLAILVHVDHVDQEHPEFGVGEDVALRVAHLPAGESLLGGVVPHGLMTVVGLVDVVVEGDDGGGVILGVAHGTDLLLCRKEVGDLGGLLHQAAGQNLRLGIWTSHE